MLLDIVIYHIFRSIIMFLYIRFATKYLLNLILLHKVTLSINIGYEKLRQNLHIMKIKI